MTVHRRFHGNTVLSVLAIALLTAMTCFGATEITYPFLGVTHYHRTETVPRVLDMHIIEIDLAAPGISIAVTPDNGAKPGDTTRQRTTDFVAQTGAQIGINGTFYTTNGTGVSETGQTEYYANLTYFAYSGGNPVSTWSGTGNPRERGINFESDNGPTFIKPDAINQANYKTRPAGVPLYNAIASYDGILIGSTNMADADDYALHPRTAMGINKSRTKLFLFTVDGRQPGYSEGMRAVEVAQLLKDDYGVSDAINLDGGGSTTLVFADPTVRVINRISDPAERLHGCNLAVFASPMPPLFAAGSFRVRASGNGTEFTLLGSRGFQYEVQVSSDLQNWTPLSLITLSNTSAELLDPESVTLRRFYRARLVR